MSDNKKSGIHDLIPMAIFVGVWILLGYIDDQSPGEGAEILKSLLWIGGALILIKCISIFSDLSKAELTFYSKKFGKYLIGLALLTLVVGLLDCGGNLNLNGVRGL
ncbi:MAG: hypothetical protein ACI9T9_001987 [Oleiphilaceae bacterium]|jgi:hypothetical protein